MVFTLASFVAVTALVAFISWLKTRGTDETSQDGYFLGGRSLTGIVIFWFFDDDKPVSRTASRTKWSGLCRWYHSNGLGNHVPGCTNADGIVLRTALL